MIENLNESENDRPSSRKINIKKGYHGLICLNSISYMAGALDAWETTKVGCSEKLVKFERQQFNDGKI